MSSSEMQVKEVKEIVADVEAGRPHTNALLALITLREAGFCFVGTSDPTPVTQHQPRSNPRIRSLLHNGVEFYLGEPGQSLLQFTWSGKLAILHARCGDVNVPGQRESLGMSYGSFGNQYGWRSAPPLTTEATGKPVYHLDERDIIPHASRPFLTKLHQTPRDVSYVDILRMPEEDAYEYNYVPGLDDEPTMRNGILLTPHAQDVVARMAIRGRDIRLIDVEARPPEAYERSIL